jgi:hypothetical protein
MPKLRSETFRVRASTKGYATLDFTDNRGRMVQIEFPSAGLPRLATKLQEAAEAAPLYREAVQLGESTLNSRQSGVRLDVARPKQLVPGPHGSFQFGTSVDVSKVLITVHVPQLGAIDFVMEPNDAKKVLDGLARMIALVEGQHVETQQ